MLKKHSIILFASSDPGGARVLLPVINYLAAKNQTVYVHEHGSILCERLHPNVKLVDVKCAAEMLKNLKVEKFVFASSVKDNVALVLGLHAKELGIEVIHILDNWMNYRSRLILSDGRTRKTLTPDQYLVMDHLAAAEAINEGVIESTIFVAGHPSIESTIKDERLIEVTKINCSNRKRVTFVSEPMSEDYGFGKMAKQFSEYNCILALINAMLSVQSENRQFTLHIAIHPRQSLEKEQEKIAKIISSLIPTTDCKLDIIYTTGRATRDAVIGSDYIFGITSILLYEAWLMGKAVAIIGKNRTMTAKNHLSKRAGIRICHRPKDIENILKMTESVNSNKQNYQKFDRQREHDKIFYQNSTKRISNLILGLETDDRLIGDKL
ncbi:hypothetical protein N9E16_00965 [Planktomarina temperata]|nr:hypothetical protein [bacterium]MDA9971777.1 hypothetical protein [Planktomarina temperata]